MPSSIDTTVGWPLGPPTSRAVLPSAWVMGQGHPDLGTLPALALRPQPGMQGCSGARRWPHPQRQGCQSKYRTPSYTGISDEEQITFHLGTCLY